jgi:DtxR family Mn-dependent transcriptional regulator
VPNDTPLNAAQEDLLEQLYLHTHQGRPPQRHELARSMQLDGTQLDHLVRQLTALGLLIVTADGTIHLSDEGGQRARAVLHRHRSLRDFFIEVLGVPPESADNGACRIEHVISDEILESMITYTRAVRKAEQSSPHSPVGRHSNRFPTDHLSFPDNERSGKERWTRF